MTYPVGQTRDSRRSEFSKTGIEIDGLGRDLRNCPTTDKLTLTVKRAVGFVGLKFSTSGIHGRGGGGPAVTEIVSGEVKKMACTRIYIISIFVIIVGINALSSRA